MSYSVLSLAPGAAVAVTLGAVARRVSEQVAGVSWVAFALGFGLVLGNANTSRRIMQPGFRWARHHLLRLAVVLIGFRLTFADLVAGGALEPILVGLIVIAAMAITYGVFQRFRLGRQQSLLTAIGYAVCGASAIAALAPVTGADDEDIAYSVATVTLFGSVAVAALPVIGRILGLNSQEFGWWVGASVHDVAQVVGAATVMGEGSLDVAVVVKLLRVLFLIPAVAIAAMHARRASKASSTAETRRSRPWFVLLFCVAAGFSTTGLIPSGALYAAQFVERVGLAGALVAIGAAVRLTAIREAGLRPIAAGFVAWLALAAIALPVAMVVR